jgi:hypothetical protein
MRQIRIAHILILLASGVAVAVGACGKSGSSSAADAAAKPDTGDPGGQGGSAPGGSGGSGGVGPGGTGGGGGSAPGGTGGTAGAPGTGGIPGSGGSKNVCEGKAPNCHPYPYGCQGSECINCPCEGGVGGAPGTGGIRGSGGAGGPDASAVDSCYDDKGNLKAALKACSSAGDCRPATEVNCCGTDRILGFTATIACQMAVPDCSYRGCMKWTYITAEDGNTTEKGGTLALQCVAGLCSTYVIAPVGEDGGRPDAPTDTF